MFDAKKSVDAALTRERLHGWRTDHETLRALLSEIGYCEASGLQQGTIQAWRTEVERRLSQTMAPPDSHLRDAKRDAIALYHATINGDQDGTAAILRGTPCEACLAVQATVLGLVLATEDITNFELDEHGRLHVTGPERKRFHQLLTTMRANLT